MAKILSFPSMHPYMSKFHGKEDIIFVNPETDFFSDGICTENFLEEKFPPSTYDLAHIHFSFDQLPISEFEKLLKYFKRIKKPIVWTCHSKESQRIKNYENGKYQKLLFRYSDKIISPTNGCAKWIQTNLGIHKREITIIPLGYFSNPEHVIRLSKEITKDKKLFTMLIADFRENREILQSIINFLQCTELNDAKLQLIFKPINIYPNGYELIDGKMLYFFNLLSNPRILTTSLPFIPNDGLLVKAFLASHAIILPYKWGTHSGQLELARDCGCHVVASNVGFYEEQWKDVCLYNVSDNKFSAFPSRYTNALIKVYHRESIQPAGKIRLKEFNEIVKNHSDVYSGLLNEFSKQ